jgi:hypothetical protein
MAFVRRRRYRYDEQDELALLREPLVRRAFGDVARRALSLANGGRSSG